MFKVVESNSDSINRVNSVSGGSNGNNLNSINNLKSVDIPYNCHFFYTDTIFGE